MPPQDFPVHHRYTGSGVPDPVISPVAENRPVSVGILCHAYISGKIIMVFLYAAIRQGNFCHMTPTVFFIDGFIPVSIGFTVRSAPHIILCLIELCSIRRGNGPDLSAWMISEGCGVSLSIRSCSHAPQCIVVQCIFTVPYSVDAGSFPSGIRFSTQIFLQGLLIMV